MPWLEAQRISIDGVKEFPLFCKYCNKFEDGSAVHVSSKGHLKARLWQPWRQYATYERDAQRAEQQEQQFDTSHLPTPPPGERSSWTRPDIGKFVIAEREIDYMIEVNNVNEDYWCQLCARFEHGDGGHAASIRHLRLRLVSSDPTRHRHPFPSVEEPPQKRARNNATDGTDLEHSEAV